MENKTAYEKKAQAKLDELNGQIEVLKAKKDDTTADLQIEYGKKIDELNSLKDETVTKLAEIKRSGNNAWQELKGGFEQSSKTMQDAINSAISKFS